jgi:CheY-like chemotaxis protein
MMDRLSGGETPDLILLDLELPGLSGVQALRKIRVVCPDLPVLVLTAHAEAPPRGIYGGGPWRDPASWATASAASFPPALNRRGALPPNSPQ